MHETEHKERALLVVVKERRERLTAKELAAEFRGLVSSTGTDIAAIMPVNLDFPSASLYVGKGKAAEIGELAADLGVDVVIFNCNLSFSQQRNLEDIFRVKTIDRTQLILDIFARHAHSQEGILQVELAQLEYLLPRLRGKGVMLSRLGGGIGTRGPGEKKLEIDRRRISERVRRIKVELAAVKAHHALRRKKRQKADTVSCSLVGYTNAGKTSLFNLLTESQRQASGAMFTTLDTVSRTFDLDEKMQVVISDTVGFIYNLPPYLFEAFKTTLDELNYADLLIHVIDAAGGLIGHCLRTVDDILGELCLKEKQAILVFNKIDSLGENELACLRREFPEAVFVSAKEGAGVNELRFRVREALFRDIAEVVAEVQFSNMAAVDFLHRSAEVLKVNYEEQRIVFWVRVRKNILSQLESKGVRVLRRLAP